MAKLFLWRTFIEKKGTEERRKSCDLLDVIASPFPGAEENVKLHSCCSIVPVPAQHKAVVSSPGSFSSHHYNLLQLKTE